MSYETGIATDPDDLLDKLRIFLLAEGWTVNGWTADNYTNYTEPGMLAGNGYRLHVQKAAADGTQMYFNFRSCIRNTPLAYCLGDFTPNADGRYDGEVTGISINGSTGYSGAGRWSEEPGACQENNQYISAVATRLPTSGIPAYYFFTIDETVVVVIEIASNEFQWLVFGQLVKSSAYTGGQFFTGSNYGYAPEKCYFNAAEPKAPFMAMTTSVAWAHTGLYIGADGVTGWRRDRSSISAASTENLYVPFSYEAMTESTWSPSLIGGLLNKTPNADDGNIALFPLYMTISRSSGLHTYVGYPAGLAAFRIDLITPKTELALGSDTWVLFPSHKKGTGLTHQNLGIAVKKVV